MKSRFFLLISLLFWGILSNVYAASYWIIQAEMQRLLHIQKDVDDVRIVESYPVIEPQVDYVVDPNDSTCWVTSAFQGQVTRYGKGEPLVISSFGAPMSLAIDAEREVLWVADGALNQIVKMRLDGTLEKRIQLRASSRSIALRADGGLWIATNRGLIIIDSNGDMIKEIERKAKYLAGVPGKNGVWLADPINNHVMHLDGDGNTLAEGGLKTLSGIIATEDGGCILLGRKSAFRLDADGTLIGTLHGLDHPSRLVYQPTDESVWILQSRGGQLVKLPKEFEQKSLIAIAGLRGNDVRVESAAGIRWIPEKLEPEKEKLTMPEVEPFASLEGRPEKEEPTAKPEKPKEEKPPTPAEIEPEVEGKPTETTEPQEKNGMPEKEKATMPEVEPFASLEGRPEKEEPTAKPEKEKPPKEPEVKEKPIETAEPEELEAEEEKPIDESETKPEKQVEPSTPKPEPESKPIPEETPVKPIVVPAPPTSTLLSEPPKFENGGVLFVELYEGLSSKRVRNVPQAMGRRYAWNYAPFRGFLEDRTYTLLLGLSVEAYNSYTNRGRAKWVEMLAEGVHVAKPIAEEFRKLADKNEWTAEQTANFVLAFVQCLPYTVDDVTTGIDEFPRYAFETLVAGGGDCEDTTILAGSILLVLGYDVVALNPKGHLALGIKGNFHGSNFEHNEIHYYYSETTGTDWRVGEMPKIYIGVPVTLYEVPKQTQP